MDSSLSEQNKELQGKRKALDKLNKRVAEQTELTAQVESLQADLSDLEQESVNVDRFLTIVRKYTEVKELTHAIIHEFIDKIIIHQPDSPRKNRVQQVEIIYNNIGVFDLSALEQGQAV